MTDTEFLERFKFLYENHYQVKLTNQENLGIATRMTNLVKIALGKEI